MGRVEKHEVGSRAADLRARHHETEMFRFDVLTASLQTRRVRDRDFLAGVSVPRGYADERPRANDSWFHLTAEGCLGSTVLSISIKLGREPIDSERSVDVRFGAHSGLSSDIAPGPKSANKRRHSITSSAWASKVLGTVTPRTLAVLRLMNSSNLVGCSTGRSAGFAPLRILST